MKLCIHVRPRDDGQGWAIDVYDGRRAWTKTHLGESPLNKAECCSVCFRRVGINTGDDGTPPVDLGRCAAPGGFECRAVGQAVAGYRRENEVLRSNSDHLSSENASLAQQVESMGMRLESLAEELAKPEDVRLREVLDALDGRAVIFDGLGARVGHLLDEMDEWIERAGAAERRLKKAEDVVLMARQLTAYAWEDRLEDCEVSDSAKHDSRELSTAVWLYDQEAKS